MNKEINGKVTLGGKTKVKCPHCKFKAVIYGLTTAEQLSFYAQTFQCPICALAKLKDSVKNG